MKRVFSVEHFESIGHCVTISPSFEEAPLQLDEDPLELSVQKWEFIVETLPKYEGLEDGGRETCGLCQAHVCEECPVGDGCKETPYDDYLCRDLNYDKELVLEGALEAARAEVEFLKSLASR